MSISVLINFLYRPDHLLLGYRRRWWDVDVIYLSKFDVEFYSSVEAKKY